MPLGMFVTQRQVAIISKIFNHFLFHFYDMSIGLCHNGNLINAKSLRRELEKDGAIFHSSSDTEVLIHLIRRSSKDTLKEQIKESLNQIKRWFYFSYPYKRWIIWCSRS